MASERKKKTTTTTKRPRKILAADSKPTEEQVASLARTSLKPSVKGAVTIQEFSRRFGDLDIIGLANELSDQARAVIDGDMQRAEVMLMVQAHTLEAIFNSLAQKSINADRLDILERFLRLALKAQSQCRATLETLSAIKNPAQVAFVRQANIGYNQQVNNGTTIEDAPPARAGKYKSAKRTIGGKTT